ncbi:hypothetical protein LCM02_03960 [Lutimonas saemankumensis]|uniref:hypothetical protein n=1 Tax=Lutimonas saemankumensis TaxID=483016 RepID=UPI001CD46A09|nr:hypothetical protein [Lutimonas saemankumensis]MCA0931595.1 hypothetical protein [Lutimonas saemankumensis]
MKFVFSRNSNVDSEVVTNTHNYAFISGKKGINTKWIPGLTMPWSKAAKSRMTYRKVDQVPLKFLFNYGNKSLNRYKINWNIFPYTNYLFDNLNRIELYEPDVFFGGTYSFFSIYKILNPKRIVYNAHDLFTNYPYAPKSLTGIEKKIIEKSDLIVTTSEMTKIKLREYYGNSDKLLNLNQGIHLSEFEGIKKERNEKPKIVFAGTLSEMNHEFTVHSIETLKSYDFHFIGPYSMNEKGIYEKYENVKMHGPMKRDRLAYHLINSDVGLISYDLDAIDKRRIGTNPMKRYDYSAAKLQIVSTPLREYEVNPSELYIAQNKFEFSQCIKEAVENPRYSEETMFHLARNNSWESKFESIIKAMNLHI